MRKLILILTILYSNVNIGYACSCLTKSQITIKDYNETDAIFIGTVIRENTENGIVTAKFKVKKWFKGNQEESITYISTNEETASCGLGGFESKSEYLIFAYGKSDELGTGLCSRTTLVPNLKFPEDSSKIYEQSNFHSDTAFLNLLQQKTSTEKLQVFYYENGKKLASGKFVNKLPHGNWSYFTKDEIIQEFGAYKNGERDSIWTKYYADGTKYEESTYELGNESRNYKLYFHNGNLRQEYYKISSKDIWEYKTYYENGMLKEHFTYTPAIDEKFKLRRHYENGPFKEYSDTGVLIEKGEYYKGFRVGEWKYYNSDGDLINIKQNKTKEDIDKK